MIARIEPSVLKGTISAPPSKSMTHRLLICGGLAEGRSVIHHVAPSADVLATLSCLEKIGASCTYLEDRVEIEGIGQNARHASAVLDCKESGSTLRFFIPICSVLMGGAAFTGSKTLLSRPLEVYESLFAKEGGSFENDGEQVRVFGRLQGGSYKIKGNISSQFISGLLFALPLLEGDSIIDIIPPIESCSYIDLTIDALRQFGVRVSWQDERTLFVPGNQHYQPQSVSVEGDYSNAAFFAACNAFGGQVQIDGLNENSIQGDKAYERFFPMLQRGTPTIHLGGCPDLGPILFAFAAAENGGIFTGTRRLKLKESDRSAAMAEELQKMGVSVKIEEDSVVVYPVSFHAPKEPLCGHNDHRIVMALTVLLLQKGGVLKGAEAVAKSMPDFFEKMQALGARISLEK